MGESCVIVGGGVQGLLTARTLLQAGMAVTVLERGETGRESSWAGGGIVGAVCPWQQEKATTQLILWSQERFQALADDLRESTGIDPELHRCGMLYPDPSDEEAAADWAAQTGTRVEVLDAGRFAREHPRLRPASKALWFPDTAQLRPPRLLRALRRSVEILGGDIREGRSVGSISTEGSRVTGVKTDAGHLKSQCVTVAAGAWSQGLLTPLGLRIDIQPVRGQILLFQTDPGFIDCMVTVEKRYLIPRREGLLLVGSTVEEAGFDKSVTDEAAAELTDFARSMLPDLEHTKAARQWAGLRPGSPRGIPFIGAHPEIEGLYVSAGHFRNGIVAAPASAQLLTDLILQRTPIFNPGPYAPTTA